MTIKDTKRLITSPDLINDLVYHDITKMQREVGPLWRYMDGSMVSEADVTVLVREVERDVPEDSDVGPSVHKHDVNQLYCLLGEIKIEVTLEGEKHLVKGPASILVPAGTNHAIRFAGGKGYLVNVLSKATYG
jgi:mannose-6-phosphate isomerase-like protein (cupin superfamily)